MTTLTDRKNRRIVNMELETPCWRKPPSICAVFLRLPFGGSPVSVRTGAVQQQFLAPTTKGGLEASLVVLFNAMLEANMLKLSLDDTCKAEHLLNNHKKLSELLILALGEIKPESPEDFTRLWETFLWVTYQLNETGDKLTGVLYDAYKRNRLEKGEAA